jgi:hypothetical protein
MAPNPIGGGGNRATAPGQLARRRSQSAVRCTLGLCQHYGTQGRRRRCRRVRQLVRDHISARVEQHTNQVGDLAFYEGVPATV